MLKLPQNYLGIRMNEQAIKTERYFNIDEIQEHIKNVEFIIMATPAPEKFKKTPIHFTIFLNTYEDIPQDIQKAILEKFRSEQGITEPAELMMQLMPVGFAQAPQDTPMPMLIVKPKDMQTIPNVPMFVMDFLADSDNFEQVKERNLTGWTYSYN